MSTWDGSFRPLVIYVKDNMKDPNSFEHIQTKFGDFEELYFYVSMKYRGKNSYGGYTIAYIDAKVNYEGKILEIEKTY